MLFFLAKGYRVIAHDRRGHGRSSQVSDGHDMDHYAADVAAVITHLDLQNAIHVGHSTGGGEATRYTAKYGDGRVSKLVLIGAVPPIMVKHHRIRMDYPLKCLTDSEPPWRLIDHSFIRMSRADHSMASIDRTPCPRKP